MQIKVDLESVNAEAKMSKNRYFDLAGTKIVFVDPPDIINYVVGRAFSLSEIEPCDPDITFNCAIHKDETFIDKMPADVYDEFNKIEERDDPCFYEGENGRLFAIVRNMGCASYALTTPPYSQVAVVCQTLTKEETPLHLQVILIPIISHLMMLQGKFIMHAGCVATPEGKGLVLMADSGGGKTTTVFTLTCNGFNFLSDDLVVACPTDEGYVYRPIQERINVTSKTIKFFPELRFAKKKLKKIDATKLPVDPHEVFGKEKIKETAQASTIIFIKLNKEGPKLVPLDGSAILKPLLKSNTFARYKSIPKAQIETIWNLLEQTKTFALYTGSDPHLLGEWLAERAVEGVLFGEPSKKLAHRSVKKQAQRKKEKFVLGLEKILADTLDDQTINTEIDIDGRWLSRFSRQIRYHRIDNLVAQYLVNQGTKLPLGSTADPVSVITKAKAAGLRLSATAKTIFQEFAGRDIPALALRGPTFAQDYYPNSYLRIYRDIDVIVQEPDLQKAQNLLVDRGFSPEPDQEYWIGKGEMPFTNGQVRVELHWDAYPVMNKEKKPFYDFRQQLQNTDLDGLTVQTVNVNHLLLSTCFHLYFEHRMDRLCRLIDIRQIIKKGADSLDWDWMVNILPADYCRFAFWLPLVLAADLVGAQVPHAALQRIAPRSFKEKMASRLFTSETFLAMPKKTSPIKLWMVNKIVG
jgi:hypothetical protein